MKNLIYILFILLNLQFLTAGDSASVIESLKRQTQVLEHHLDEIKKAADDVLWYQRVGDAAFIDKVFITGPPKANIKNPDAMGAKNPLKFWCYIFIPKRADLDKKYPLIILPHGGVHANFTTYYTHIVLEMLAQGYVVAAPEYRGSTGYGEGYYKNIDYGGMEVEDCDAAREYLLDNYDFVDGSRVGVVGWSHGGLIALMSVFNHPSDYKAAFAGVPVSDLVMRMGYQEEDYPDEFSADYHIGRTVFENLEEYKRRSPVWNVEKLRTPLLIHTNTNDDDVNWIEVQHLIQALKAEGKKFEYEIFKDQPGGHSFDRIDIKNARQIRLKIYKFLAEYLNPPNPFKTLKDIEKAAYIRK
ncbi:MAG: hypothetical protein QG635_1076 [Bacteroidota bacterium]|nr:hypothetical protein [Bacteroidota bacterium]